MVSGTNPDAASRGWRELRLLVRGVVRLVVWSGLFIGGLTVFFAAAPSAGAALRHASRTEALSMFVALVVMAFALVSLVAMLTRKAPGRNHGIAVHVLVIAAGAAAIYWRPVWSGIVAVAAYILLIVVPTLLIRRAFRQFAAGHPQRAARTMRRASLLHPSPSWRFHADLFAAQALGAIDAEVAAYEALARTATPEQATTLGQWTAIARDDWTSVLDQVRGANRSPVLEIRALGELGRIDETIAICAALPRRFDRTALVHCRLYALAFGGRREAVAALLRGRLKHVADRSKAYWSFVAAQAAGAGDDAGLRRALADCARAGDDESFRRAAERHLAAPARSAAVALSPGSLATIARIEAALR